MSLFRKRPEPDPPEGQDGWVDDVEYYINNYAAIKADVESMIQAIMDGDEDLPIYVYANRWDDQQKGSGFFYVLGMLSSILEELRFDLEEE